MHVIIASLQIEQQFFSLGFSPWLFPVLFFGPLFLLKKIIKSDIFWDSNGCQRLITVFYHYPNGQGRFKLWEVQSLIKLKTMQIMLQTTNKCAKHFFLFFWIKKRLANLWFLFFLRFFILLVPKLLLRTYSFHLAPFSYDIIL